MELACSQPPPLTEDEISAALDGDAGQSRVQDHIARCPACRERLNQARRVEQMLRTRRHPLAQALGDYQQGLLDDPERAAIESHLAHCASCRMEMAQLTAFLDDESAPAMPPEAQPERALLPRLNQMLKKLIPSSPTFAFRGGSQSEPLVLIAGEITVFLEIQPAADGKMVAGQIEAAQQSDWYGALVMLRQTNDVALMAVVDDMGQFSCGPMMAGLVALRIASATGQMLVLDGADLNQLD